jgi:hypothetical protein
MTADQAKAEGQTAPIKIEIPGVGGVDVDPQATIAGALPGTKGES